MTETTIQKTSYFNGGVLSFVGINIFSFLVTLLSCGLLFPLAFVFKKQWINAHTYVGGCRLKFIGNPLEFFFKWILWCFLTLITLGIYPFWIPQRVQERENENTIFDSIF